MPTATIIHIINISVFIFSLSSLLLTIIASRFNKIDFKYYLPLHISIVLKHMVFILTGILSRNALNILTIFDVVLISLLLFLIFRFICSLYGVSFSKLKMLSTTLLILLIGVVLYIFDFISENKLIEDFITIYYYLVFFLLLLFGYFQNKKQDKSFWYNYRNTIYISLFIIIPVLIIDEAFLDIVSDNLIVGPLLLFISWTIVNIFILVVYMYRSKLENRINSTVLKVLTNRELEISLELKRGLTYSEVGEKLHISLATVKTHVYKIYQKLEIKNKIELIDLLTQ